MSKLPSPDDPLIDSIGGKVYAATPTGVATMDDALDLQDYIERKPRPLFKTFQPSEELSLQELPDEDDKQQIGIAAVIGLRMMGLDLGDIAIMLDTSVDEINRIINMPATQTSFEMVFGAIIDTNSSLVQGRISANANDAVGVVTALMNDDKTRADVRLKAAQDVLDRSGTNADQFYAAKDDRKGSDDALTIVVMDDAGDKERVNIKVGK